MSEITTAFATPTYVYVNALVDELQRGGLRHAVVCPGSRSTPLALTLVEAEDIHVWMHIDERSAAFFALGLAKRLNQPVALLCTSGTASANFLPAIVEAHLSHIPLLVLTSDRPPELRNCGAPQAIDQNQLYGSHVKWFAEVALPEATNPALRYIRTLAHRSLALTRTLPRGPVHLNMPFREPLTPAPVPAQPLPDPEQRDVLAWQGRPNNQPYIYVDEAAPVYAANASVTALVRQITAWPRGLILVGPQSDPALVLPLIQLAQHAGYPILADPLSQLRSDVRDNAPVISSYDAFLRNEQFSDQYAPQLVLRFGAMPTAKPLLLYLQRHAAHCIQIVVDGQESWEEPTQLVEQMLHADPITLCQQLCTALVQAKQDQQERSAWTTIWLRSDRTTRLVLASGIEDMSELFEGRVFSELAGLLPTDSLLFAGNSMPVRDMDTFFWCQERSIRCLGNRGANGIDGVVSSALGASAAGGSLEPAVLVIGDLSFFHDLNGLLAARLHKLNLVIVLVNNNGGGIFSFLSQAAYPAHFEQLFGTPTGLDFRLAVEMYGGTFQRITDWEMFRQALKTGLAQGGLHVVEVPTARESNVLLHRQLWQLVDKALQQARLIKKNEA
jgi:2-succinyl-5-enolpyruvyl-6-hydroxy-3-cyclohexene-1-carboxylate synthase